MTPDPSEGSPTSRIKVSVVVAVYNTGTYLGPCVGSLLRQSMDRSEYEVILVDDGSTDLATRARLVRYSLIKGVTVIRIPNSGWPGRPRNVGIERARGEYVYVVDHDDTLGREALERVHAMGVAQGSDVVIGKVVGAARRTPRTLFDRDRPRCTVEDSPIVDSLTPHKAFRRQFLLDHDLRFPEGRRRLEDHHFVGRAYLLADTISVLGSYACYHHTSRPGNAGAIPTDPVDYYRDLRDVVAAVLPHARTERARTMFLRRWLRGEVLYKLRNRHFVRIDAAFRTLLVREARAMGLDLMDHGLTESALRPVEQLQWPLLLAADTDGLLRLARWQRALRTSTALRDVRATGDGISLSLRVRVVDREGTSVLDTGPDGRPRLVPPAEVGGGAGSTKRLKPRGSIVLVGPKGAGTVEVRASCAEVTVEGEPAVDLEATVPSSVLSGLAEGSWTVHSRTDVARIGLSRSRSPVTDPGGAADRPGPGGEVSGSSPTVRWSPERELVLEVGARPE